MRLFKNIKIGILSITFGVLAITPKTAHAVLGIGDRITEGFIWLMQAAGAIALFIMQWVVAFAAGLVNYVLQMNFLVTSQGFNGVATNGWMIARDVANLGFVLALIIIAVATILRFQEYGVKKMLLKFIAAAIIVNFSFVIAASVINFSHVVTDFFLERATAPAQGIDASTETVSSFTGIRMAEMITGAFNIQRLYMVDETYDFNEIESSITSLEAVFYTMAGVSFSMIFTALLIIVLLALALMLLVRYVALTILLILAPLAWLFWIIPSLQGNFKKWWSKFMEWTFFAPAVVFFIYIALAGASSLGGIPAECQGTGGTFLQCVISQGMGMIVIGALLLGGLIVAQSLSITFGKESVDVFKGTLAWGQNKIWGGAKGAGRGIREGIRDRALTAGTKTDDKGETTSGMQRWVSQAARIPLIGKAFRGTAEKVGKARQDLAKQVEERQKDLGSITNSDLMNRVSISKMESYIKNPVEASALINEVAKRGMIADVKDKLDPKKWDALIQAAKSTGKQKDILIARPDMAPDFGENIKDTVRGIGAGSIEKMAKDSLKNEEVVLNMSNSQLNKLGTGDTKKIEEFLNTLNKLKIDQLNDDDKKNFDRIDKFLSKNNNFAYESRFNSSDS